MINEEHEEELAEVGITILETTDTSITYDITDLLRTINSEEE